MQKAEKSYKQALVWFQGNMTGQFPVKTAAGKFLLWYFLVNKLMVIVFLLVFVAFNSQAVFYFPVRLYNVIYSLVMKQELWSFNFVKTFITENLVSILFYILLFRLVKRVLRYDKKG